MGERGGNLMGEGGGGRGRPKANTRRKKRWEKTTWYVADMTQIFVAKDVKQGKKEREKKPLQPEPWHRQSHARSWRQKQTVSRTPTRNQRIMCASVCVSVCACGLCHTHVCVRKSKCNHFGISQSPTSSQRELYPTRQIIVGVVRRLLWGGYD